MNLDRLHKFMAFMMNVYANMAALQFGDIVLKYLIIYLFPLSLMEKYFVFMVDYLQAFKHLIK